MNEELKQKLNSELDGYLSRNLPSFSEESRHQAEFRIKEAWAIASQITAEGLNMWWHTTIQEREGQPKS